MPSRTIHSNPGHWHKPFLRLATICLLEDVACRQGGSPPLTLLQARDGGSPAPWAGNNLNES